MFTRKESVLKWGAALGVFAVGAMFWACSGKDGVAGGASGDMGIVAKDIAGEAQKGPFVKGSAVTVQGIDCKTLQLTDEHFEGKVKSDKGNFAFDDVTLSSTCALFEATGKYRNELTGKKSSEELTLHALTDLKDRKNVNVNVLTELEYERVMFLVTEKGKKFADAKERAEKEVLAAFGIDGDFDNSEDLTIYESGDGNAALLAVSVLMLAETDDAGLVKRIEKFADSFAETGKWNDDKTKATIEEWQVVATADGTLDSIRKNVEGWGYADVVPAFEKYIEVFGDTVILSSDSESSSSVTPKSSDSETSVSSSSSEPAEGSFTDPRDGKTYRTVKIGDQVWMAENLNIETDSSYCYNDSTKYCSKYGRLYSWAVANSVCPEGWHLPTIDEFETLFATVGGDSVAGAKLKSTSGWNSNGNGTDDFGFTVLPAGGWMCKDFVGEAAVFWTSEWNEGYDDYVYGIKLYTDNTIVRLTYRSMYYAYSVRCVKGSATVPPSSSSSKPVETSSSSGNSSSSQFKRVLCNVDTDKNCFKDERDGQTYRMVKIGNQVWMAENLNYETAGSYCYNDSAENCKNYGRLYTWGAAMDSAGVWSTDGKGCGRHILDGDGFVCSATFPVRGVCPEGWHLPDTTEWYILFAAVGGQSSSGKALKSTSGWDKWDDNGNGEDTYGFSGLPAGASSYDMFQFALFWSSVEHYTGGYNIDAYGMSLYYKSAVASLYREPKSAQFSVRCLKNDDATVPKSSSSVGSSSSVTPQSSSSKGNGSSSGVTPQSSSSSTSVSSSSSVALATSCKTETKDNCEYGTLVDSRDGQTYKTVEIGNQVWMAENLNYAYTGVPFSWNGHTSNSSSWCYGDDPANCTKYGRLYTWAAAIDSVALYDGGNGVDCGYGKTCTLPTKVRGVCPEGWHLPTQTEWKTLITAVGDSGTVGKMLKFTSGWICPDGDSRNGTDEYAFTALPAGIRFRDGTFSYDGIDALFWASTESNGNYAYSVELYCGSDGASLYGNLKDYGFSVRCVKN